MDTPSPVTTPAVQEEPPRRSWLQGLSELLQTVLLAGLLFMAVNFLTARIRVDGSSMEPTLHNGEFVVVNRLAYRWSDLTRGDIVVFRFPLNPERRFIKRIIGLPGDHIRVENGVVVVNNSALQEPYIAAPPRYSGNWQVGPDEAFVLGDNRNNSQDSQNWGMLPIEDIIGRAVLVYWPLPKSRRDPACHARRCGRGVERRLWGQGTGSKSLGKGAVPFRLPVQHA